MGSYFAIPPSVNLGTLDLRTPQGLMLAQAAQDYGVYVTDTSGSQSLYCEDDDGPALAFGLAVLGGDYSAHDPRVVFNALRVVTNNSTATPNGGAPGAPRRGHSPTTLPGPSLSGFGVTPFGTGSFGG